MRRLLLNNYPSYGYHLLKKVNEQIDLSLLEIPLQDMKLICMLLDDEQHEQVLSLTEETVRALDSSVEKLKLDGRNAWKYFARSRLNNKTGSFIRCKMHLNAAQLDHKDTDYPLLIDDDSDYRYGKLGEFKVPTSATCVTYFKVTA